MNSPCMGVIANYDFIDHRISVFTFDTIMGCMYSMQANGVQPIALNQWELSAKQTQVRPSLIRLASYRDQTLLDL